MNDRLYRSRDDRILAGVAGGVADSFGIDPSLVRILWVILTPLTGGLVILLYVVMAFIVPEEPAGNDRWAAWNQNGWGQAPGSPGPAGPGPTDWNASPGPGDAGPAGSAAAGFAATDAAGTGAAPGSAATDTTAFDPAVATGLSAATVAGSSAGAVAGAPPSATGPIPATGPLPVPGAVDPGAAPFGGFAASSAPPPPVPPSAAWTSSDPRSQRQAARDARHAARDARRAERHRDGTGALIVGLVLVLIGAFFLARAYIPNLDADRIWPILLVGIGVILLVGSIRRSSPPQP